MLCVLSCVWEHTKKYLHTMKTIETEENPFMSANQNDDHAQSEVPPKIVEDSNTDVPKQAVAAPAAPAVAAPAVAAPAAPAAFVRRSVRMRCKPGRFQPYP